jgi:hypothetical protein
VIFFDRYDSLKSVSKYVTAVDSLGIFENKKTSKMQIDAIGGFF